MNNLKELNLTSLTEQQLEDTNGGIIPAVYAAVILTQHAVAIYGAASVAKAAGIVAGAAAYTYVNS